MILVLDDVAADNRIDGGTIETRSYNCFQVDDQLRSSGNIDAD
jgi:hypothetical protein